MTSQFFNIRYFLILTIFTLGSLVGCSGGGSSSGGNTVASFKSTCGVLKDGSIKSEFSVNKEEGAILTAVVGSNLIEVLRAGDSNGSSSSEYVQIFGIKDSNAVSQVKSILQSYVGQTVYLIKPSSTCERILRNGSIVPVYQVVSSTGVNFAEILIASGVSEAEERALGCGEEVYGGCLAKTGTSQITSAKQVSNFLWKPSSESPQNPGGLAILSNPCDADVYVNGESIFDHGPSNGRCITARAARSGCGFGLNAEVTIIDHASGEPVYFGASPSMVIANGCDRFEYDGIGVGGEASIPACIAAPSTVQYIPNHLPCGGNAAAVLSGDMQFAFSVQLRLPDNSDRLDLSCSESFCSPYKVQKYIDGAGTYTACFGAPGSDVVMSEIVQISIKRAGDDSNPVRVCLDNPGVGF